MLNLQIGILKDLQKQGFLTKPQMEAAIVIITQEYRKTNEASHEADRTGKSPVLLAHATGAVTA